MTLPSPSSTLAPQPETAPATPLQRRLWFLARLSDTAQPLTLSVTVPLPGPVDPHRLQAALTALARRHPALRTHFRRLPWGALEQVVEPAAVLPLDDAAPLDPERAPLARARATAAGVELTVHQMIADRASAQRLAEDLAALYAGAALPPAPGFAATATAWERRRAAGAFDAALARWRDILTAVPQAGTLPGERPGAEPCALTLALPPAPEATLRAAFAVLLGRLTRQPQVRLGLRLPAAEDSVGPHATVHVAAVDMDDGAPFAAVAAALEAEAAGEPLPLDWLLQDMPGRADVQGRGPLVLGLVDATGVPGVRGVPVQPCDLVLETGGDGPRLVSAGGRFDEAGLQVIADALRALLTAALAAPQTPVGDLPLVDRATLDRLSAPYTDPLPIDPAPVPVLIARQAARRPAAPAVVAGDGSGALTFGALEAAANRMAHALVAAGVGREQRVAVAVERAPHTIALLLAVLKAGGAFVPLDPEYPADRLTHILTDAGARLVVGTREVLARLPAVAGVTALAREDMDRPDAPDTPPAVTPHPQQLAYTVYTSGSTGRPKGVDVAHAALSMHCQATARVYDMDETAREFHFLSLGFDGAHERWMVPLCVGGRVVLRGPALWSAGETLACLRRHGITNAGFPPRYLHHLAEWADTEPGPPPPLRLYSFGGEAMPPATLDLVRRALRPQTLINGYGPTETVISPLVWKVAAAEAAIDGPAAPIGRAVGRRRAYVLDDRLRPLPPGMAGELYIGGLGLARGYAGRSAATAERFLPDPFAGDGGRMYRTGDLARWQPDGTVEYLGRADHQVQVRGFRVELQEIEARLAELPGVREAAAALCDGPAGQRLVGWAVAAEGARLDPEALRRDLAARLPDYMVPADLVVTDALPRSPAGKLDRAALVPPPPGGAAGAGRSPSTPTERLLADLWARLLGLPEVGVDRSFFALGGDSLTALRMIAELRTLTPGRTVTVVDLFNNPEIAALAAALDGSGVGGRGLVHLQREGSRPVVYCFPGLLVSSREYEPLARHLGPDQPVAGFVCHTLAEGHDGGTPRVEDLAEGYAAAIRGRSGGDSCTLLGWSWGGILAYETARRLQGDVDVRFVGMLDVCALDAEFAVGAETALPPAERARLAAEVAAWLGRSRMRAAWDSLIGRMDDTIHTQFLRFIRKSEEGLPLDGPAPGSREHIFWTLVDHALVFRTYAMAPFDCPIHVWVAEDSMNRGLNVIDWRQHSRRVERSVILPGTTHLGIVGAPAFHESFRQSLAGAFGQD